MRVHYLQHVPFEDLGSMEASLARKGHHLSATHLYLNQELPALNALDWLIIMGGPMGVGDEALYPWMAREKAFIKTAIEADKIVLGICLGAQFIADAYNERVYRNTHREIGWFPIYDTEQARGTIVHNVIPSGLEVFHWHGDTFDIPKGANPLASSAACPNQGFIVDDRVIALQFHLETTPESAKALLDNCGHELDDSRHVQNKEEIMAKTGHCALMNKVMTSLLSRLETNAAQ